jgi:hypothetical protein
MKNILFVVFLLQIYFVHSLIKTYVEISPRHYCERRISFFTAMLAKQVTVDSRAICPFTVGPVGYEERAYKIKRVFFDLTTGGATPVQTLDSQSTYIPTVGISYTKHPYPKPDLPENEVNLYLGQVFFNRFVLYKDTPGGTDGWDTTDIIYTNNYMNDSSLPSKWEQFTKESQDLGSGDSTNLLGVKILKGFALGSASHQFEVSSREVAFNINSTVRGETPRNLAPQNIRLTTIIDQLTGLNSTLVSGIALEYYIISFGSLSTNRANNDPKYDPYPMFTNNIQTSFGLLEPFTNEQGGFFSSRNFAQTYDIQGVPLSMKTIVTSDTVGSSSFGLNKNGNYTITRVVVSIPFKTSIPYTIEFESSFGVDEFYFNSSGKFTLTLLGVLFAFVAYVF